MQTCSVGMRKYIVTEESLYSDPKHIFEYIKIITSYNSLLALMHLNDTTADKGFDIAQLFADKFGCNTYL